jgi:hypothetical protein
MIYNKAGSVPTFLMIAVDFFGDSSSLQISSWLQAI